MAKLTTESSERAVYSSLAAPADDVYRGADETLPKRSVDVTGIALGLALCASIAAWFSSIRAPLWLDETISYWQISGGFWRIWERQGLSPAAYASVLWATNALFGSNEIVLRIPSVLAMLAATYVLYLIAREFFSSDIAATVAIIFCLHPTVAFAAVDARPYAFAVLVVNCAILSLLRFVKTNSSVNAIVLGALAAAVFYFHYLFGLLLIPALALVFFAWEWGEWRRFAPKLAIASVAFSVMILPVLGRLVYLFRTGQSHVFEQAPQIGDLLFTLAPGRVLAPLFLFMGFAAALLGRLESPSQGARREGLACLFLAAIPLGVLYDVSTLTSLHMFTDRYRLVAVPGIALCWGFLASCVRSKAVRAAFGVALVVLTFSSLSFGTLTIDNEHGYSWKDALLVADRNAAGEAPLLICSDLPESNFEPMPADVYAARDGSFAPLSYYKVHTRVVPLPRALNEEARTQINNFLAAAIPAKQRFEFLGFFPSNPTRDWITERTRDTYVAKRLGSYDGITVMEYVPR